MTFYAPFSGSMVAPLGVVPTAAYLPLVSLLEDRFTTSIAAPIPSPHTMEPGGSVVTQWNIIDATNKLSISSAALQWAGTKNTFNDPSLTAATAITRVAGLAFYCEVNQITNGSAATTLRFHALEPTVPPTTNAQSAIGWPITTRFVNFTAGDTGITLGNVQLQLALNTTYKFICIVEPQARYFYVKGGVYSEWKLVLVSRTLISTADLATSFYLNFRNAVSTARTFALTNDNAKAVNLPIAGYITWSSVFGPLYAQKLGNVSAGDAIAHPADGIVYCNITTFPTTDLIMRFRMVDNSNYWSLRAHNTGSAYQLILEKTVAGSTTTINTVSFTAISGMQLFVRMWGSNLVYQVTPNGPTDTTVNVTGGTFDTATQADIQSLGGGVVQDLTSIALDPSGEALASLLALEAL